MDRVIKHGVRSGQVKIPASKSQAHRALILSAISQEPVRIILDGISKDIQATADCLQALGAGIRIFDGEISVTPIDRDKKRDKPCELRCAESGSTLRFMLPLAGAFGAEGRFLPQGRLMQRPLAPFDECLTAHGMKITKTCDSIFFEGQLRSGEYELPGNVSSQYISGLLMALPLADGKSVIRVSGKIESASYITMTQDLLKTAGACVEINVGGDATSYEIAGGAPLKMPQVFEVEGDFSSAAFYICMGALSEKGICVRGLNLNTSQPDRAVIDVIKSFGADVSVSGDEVTVRKNKLKGVTIDASQIPDIIPVLSVVAAVSEGQTRIVNAARLRIKESDRLESTAALLKAVGADVSELPDGLVINGVKELSGGHVSAYNDHRIAMSAAVAACACRGDVTLSQSECVSKSYPAFWDDFGKLACEK